MAGGATEGAKSAEPAAGGRTAITGRATSGLKAIMCVGTTGRMIGIGSMGRVVVAVMGGMVVTVRRDPTIRGVVMGGTMVIVP